MENRDENLWQLATKRTKFKGQVFTYFSVNIFLWAIWFFTKSHHQNDFIPWPAWCSIGWGFGLALSYIKLYHFSHEDQIQKEYDKLKNYN